jgi:hypothetical protein
MFTRLGYKKYDDGEAFFVENYADYRGDALDDHPALRELQEDWSTFIAYQCRS